jgi:hypothetical protein
MNQLDYMSVIKYKFQSQLLVLANTYYFFGIIDSENDIATVIRSFDCAGIAKVYITSIGIFCFDFSNSSNLASIDALEFRNEGIVPEEVVSNENEIHLLQEARVQFINFVCAVFFWKNKRKGM